MHIDEEPNGPGEFEAAADERTGSDESAPLLSHPHNGQRKETPLPRAQLAAVYFIKLTIPVVSTQVQPYLNKMISELDLPPGRPVGYYSGLLGLAINAGQFLTVFPWGRLSGTYCYRLLLPTPIIHWLARRLVW